MIRLGTTLLLSILINITAFAQENLLELDLGIDHKNDFLNERSFIDPIGESNQFFLSLPCKNQLHFYLLDHNWKIQSEFSRTTEAAVDSMSESGNSDSSRLNNNIFIKKTFEASGSINTGRNKILTAFTKSDEAIYFVDIDFTILNSSIRQQWKTSKKERLIFCFPYLNHFFWITVNKKSLNTLLLYRYDQTGKIDTMSVSLDSFFPAEKNITAGYWTDKTSLVQPERITTLLQASLRGKFFLQQHSLFIVSDENAEYTDITSVDLDSFKTDQFSVGYSLPSAKFLKAQSHNSFISNNVLFQANVQENIFTLSISNLKNRADKKIYSFGKTDEISFSNSAVKQYGTAMDHTGEKELTRPKQFIRKVNGDGLAILAGVHENLIQAQIGSSELLSTGGGGGGMYVGGGSFGTPGGVVSMPGHWSSFGGGGYKYTKTVFFQSLFDATNFEHVTNKEVKEDTIKKLDDFLDKNSKHLNDPVKLDDRIITGYLNTDTKKFILVHI